MAFLIFIYPIRQDPIIPLQILWILSILQILLSCQYFLRASVVRYEVRNHHQPPEPTR